jgi:hypothetical protein
LPRSTAGANSQLVAQAFPFNVNDAGTAFLVRRDPIDTSRPGAIVAV